MVYLLICDRDLGRAGLHAEEWMRITATIPHACSWINACACYRTSCIVNVGVKGHGLKATPLEGSLANDHGELGVSVREVSLTQICVNRS